MLALLCLAGPSSAKSLYVIASQDSEPTSRIQAYNVNADGTLTYQATYTPLGVEGDGTGLCTTLPIPCSSAPRAAAT